MENEKYKRLFLEVMDILFDNNRKHSFEYYKNYKNEISNEIGLYTTIAPDNFDLTVSDVPQGPTHYKSRKCILKDKTKLSSTSSKYLYIGKADIPLRKRVGLYIKYGYEQGNTNTAHHGGYNIWFINDNKKLLLSFITMNEIYLNHSEIFKEMFDKYNQKYQSAPIAEFFESGLMALHQLAYDCLPFANIKNGQYMDIWYDFWKNYKTN